MNRRIALFGGSTLALIVIMCAVAMKQRIRSQYHAGEIYSVQGEKGYRIAKVLVVDSTAVHVRLYKNVFRDRPLHVDIQTLTLGSIKDPDGEFGIGHMPIAATTFSSWLPVFIMHADVTQEELEGYEEWKKEKGGVFE